MAVRVGKVRGVDSTIQILRAAPTDFRRQMETDAYAVAKEISAALRSNAPGKPLSQMKNGGPVRVVAQKGGKDKETDQWRLASARMYGPVATVMSDMAAVPRKSPTFVPNLNAKYGGPSRWVWPTAMRFVGRLNAAVETASRRTEITLNAKLKRAA